MLASVSRIMPNVTSQMHMTLANEVRRLLSVYRDVELLVRVGEYQQGEDPLADLAVEKYAAINAFLQQQENEPCHHDLLLQRLSALVTP